MIHFIAGAFVGLVLARLGASLIGGARAALGGWINAPQTYAGIARREALARRAGLALAFAAFLGLAVLLYLALWRDPALHVAAPGLLDRAALALQTELAALERRLLAARGFRALLGFAFGLGLAELLSRWGAASAARAGGPGPWWISPAAALPAGLLLLAAFALVAPRGELNMAFLQRVKTPFGEAEFARDERQVRLELVSEPKGLFPFERTGLGDVIALARADLQLLEATSPLAPETARARDALAFVVEVLQPVALCIQQIDSLYGDQELLTDNLSVMGANLARALILARAGATDAGGRAPQDPEPRHALATGPWTFQINRWRERPALAATVGDDKPFTANLCDFETTPAGDPMRALGERSDAELREILAHPTVLHAASMFFLWSGNPRAARTMISRADRAFDDDPLKACPEGGVDAPRGNPGLWLISGFADRWIGQGDASVGIDKLACARRLATQRLEKLREAAGSAVDACPEPPRLAATVRYDPLATSAGPAERDKVCAGAAGAACEAQLATGYFTFLERRLRNHLVFETALAALSARDVDAARRLLDAHRDAADDLARAAEDPGRCFPVQEVSAVAAGPEEPPIAVTSVDREADAAIYLDSAALFRLARGLRWNDDAEVEAAVELFDRALAAGGDATSEALRRTIEGHRRSAMEKLGLVRD